jgi:hypothetical protein
MVLVIQHPTLKTRKRIPQGLPYLQAVGSGDNNRALGATCNFSQSFGIIKRGEGMVPKPRSGVQE